MFLSTTNFPKEFIKQHLIMSKRKVQFTEDTDDIDLDFEETDKKKKHTLDSDEEDDETGRYDVMAEDDIEGEEDTTITLDHGTKITPFNMREEMEEGHFDTQGTFIFDKKSEIRDNWMDNIDWVKIKESGKKADDDDDDDSDDQTEKIDEITIFREILEYLKPGENINKALRRLGSGTKSYKTMSASERLKAKKLAAKQKTSENGSVTNEAESAEQNKKDLDKLTELADKLLQHGNFEIYQETYEKINFKLKENEKKAEADAVVIPEGVDDDDALDMFADNIDAAKTADEANVDHSKEQPTSAGDNKNEGKPASLDDELKWEYKWKEEDEEFHGPFSSQQMLEWSETNYFKQGALCRKVGQQQIYNSRRIDFDLYV